MPGQPVNNKEKHMTEFLTRDSSLQSYMMFPRFLLTCDLSETAKLLYMVLLDRARLSQRNDGWTDERGRVFLYYPIRDLSTTLQKSEMTIKTALAALEKAALIVRERRGAGQANRLYVKCPADCFLPVRQTAACPPDGKKSVSMTDRNLSANKNQETNMTYPRKKNGAFVRSYDCKEDESL
jgi:hypothetical protein